MEMTVTNSSNAVVERFWISAVSIGNDIEILLHDLYRCDLQLHSRYKVLRTKGKAFQAIYATYSDMTALTGTVQTLNERSKASYMVYCAVSVYCQMAGVTDDKTGKGR